MCLCINPNCTNPENPDNLLFCQACGSELLLLREYRVSHLLSDKGGFGKTYEVSQGSQTKVLKVLINNQPKAIDLFQQEAQVLQQLNHPGIPKGDRYFTFLPRNSHQPLHCLVMEKIEGLDLEEYQQQRQNHPIDQHSALKWLLQLAEILDEVHQQQFFHRDIKPSNIILKPDGQLVLIDFGTVRAVTATYLGKKSSGQVTKIASGGYTPTEQLNYQAVPQSDFFALGRTFVFLLTGREPTDPEMYDPLNDELNWHSHTNNLLPELADFIDELMVRLARDRPANTQVILQRLVEIDRILNSPPTRNIPQVAATVSSLPPQQQKKSANSGSGNGGLTRRQLINAAGVGAVGLVGGVIVHQIWKSSSFSSTPTNSPTLIPDSPSSQTEGGINLQSFNFEVVTVDSFGRENSRKSRQAKFFTEDLGKVIMLEMVAIPGGSFIMGSPDTEEGRYERESPQHLVTIRPFYLSKFTITQAQWRAVAAFAKVIRNLDTEPAYFQGDNLPIEQVSWNDSQEFCARLSRETGRTYRLPSEAEWEYACRAGTTTPFHFGETITTDLANYDGNSTYGLGYKGEYRQKTTPVGSFQVANDFGLYDMHGNVWEWCEDHWHKSYHGAPRDGSVWIKENRSENDDHYNFRSLRGCSWGFGPRFCRSAYRDLNEIDYRDSDISFRVVCPNA